MAPFGRPQPGDVFGADFRIVRALKEGGMGAVYVAEQISTGALRALKLLHPQLAENEGMRRRFDQEARAAARIASDYVVAVIGAGVDEASGSPWIAMELLEGEELADHVGRRGRLPADEALGIMRMLCQAVAAAHEAGLVHRDLKPENVLLARSRRAGEAFTLKVLDFGIARATGQAGLGGGAATAALGTPLWMAPEQATAGGQVGRGTDVWALGLMVFYLLTGTFYWRSARDEQASITLFLRELVLEPIEPASVRAAIFGCADFLPAGFDEWFARCVAREPSARFADVPGAFAALEPILAPPVAAFAPGEEVMAIPSRTLATGSNGVFGRAATSGGTAPPPAFLPVAFPPAPYAVAGPPRAFVESGGTDLVFASGPRRPLATPATAPGTAITHDLDSGAREREGRSPGGWRRVGPLGLVLAVLLAATAGGYIAQHRGAAIAHADRPAPIAAAGVVHDDGANEAAVAAGRAMAERSPMVILAGALFPLGAANGAIDEGPVHDVSLPTFLIQVDEVEVAQYAACVAAGRCTSAGAEEHCNADRPGRERNPINCVTHAQAAAYCAWLGRRLPTEDEWEYAAGGRQKRRYAWGNASPNGRICWGRGAAGTCDVGSFDGGATPEGLHDMTGNVWEWTSSDYCPYDGSACARDAKVARGGGWYGKDAELVRVPVRQGYSPTTQSANVGVRCARSL